MSTNPFTAALDVQRQAFEEATELLGKAEVAGERAETAASVDVGETPSEVVYEENKLELHHYKPEEAGIEAEEQHDVPILVVYALINRPYILDLQPDRSVIRTLLEQGFDVYMIDWGEPSRLDASLTLHDYVDRYIDNCVDVVCERSELDSINVLGYCMGGTMSVMYAALHPEKVRNLGLMAAGLCFEGTGGLLELWGNEEYYSPEAVTDTFGNVPAEFLDTGFALMDPVDNFVTKYVRLVDNLESEAFIENFARMETWLGDGIDVAGDTYVQFLEDVYQDNKLYRNELSIGGEHVDLDNIEMPVLQIVGEYDHLIPPDASTPFNEVIPSEDTEIKRMRSGHIGLSVSSSSHRELWPDVCDWYAERSQAEGDSGVDPNASETAEADSGGPDVTDGGTSNDGTGQLTAVDGIGQAYAERLRGAGVEDLADLAAADPAELASDVGVAESSIADWVGQAEKLV